MKKAFLSIAAATAAAAMVPVSVQAASPKNVQFQVNDGYAVISGQGMESLQQTLKELGAVLGNGGIFCPEVPAPEMPETPNTPDIPNTPNTPDTPDTPKPDQPESEQPEENPTPDTPDSNSPVQPSPDQPETDNPENTPDTDQPSGDDNSSEENGVSVYVKQVIDLVNAERAKAGLSELKIDKNIVNAANVRAKEIKSSFSHTRPDGTSFSTALKETGVSYRGSGENIAWGQKSPEQVMESWMNSEGHRANILNTRYKNIGVGYYQDERGVQYWVQLFTY